MKTIVANWKMNLGIRESVALAHGTLLALRGRTPVPELILCPAFTALAEVHKVMAHGHAVLGAQDLFWEETGAFTGEISARMLAETGVTHVIIGHSERRRFLGETDEMVGKKVVAALAHHLTPIVCVGETAEERAAGQTEAVISRQLTAAFAHVTSHRDHLFVAYEPVWAIGSGTPASPAEAVAMHTFIRHFFQEKIAVLYGGSVDGSNAYGFLRETEIDGLLVGGASVKLQQFLDIIKAAGDVMEGLNAAKT